MVGNLHNGRRCEQGGHLSLCCRFDVTGQEEAVASVGQAKHQALVVGATLAWWGPFKRWMEDCWVWCAEGTKHRAPLGGSPPQVVEWPPATRGPVTGHQCVDLKLVDDGG